MNNKLSNILKSKIEDLAWIDKISGLVQTANIRVKNGDSVSDKSYPISCNMTLDACLKGGYDNLAPDSKKKSIVYFEDRGVSYIERKGNKIKFRSSLRLVVWLNLCLIDDSCGASGDYVIDVIKEIPSVPFNEDDLVGITITSINQAERSVDIFSKYTYNEQATQYLMYPFDYFALDIETEFIIPCISYTTPAAGSVTADSTLWTADTSLITGDAT